MKVVWIGVAIAVLVFTLAYFFVPNALPALG